MATSITPGVKTSEFWLTLVTTVLGGSVVVGLVPDAGTLSKLVALLLMVLGSYGYTAKRTELKENQ